MHKINLSVLCLAVSFLKKINKRFENFKIATHIFNRLHLTSVQQLTWFENFKIASTHIFNRFIFIRLLTWFENIKIAPIYLIQTPSQRLLTWFENF